MAAQTTTVTTADGFSNEKYYTIATTTRGRWTTNDDGTTLVSSKNGSNTNGSSTNINWAILKFADDYYAYNVQTKKFLSYDGTTQGKLVSHYGTPLSITLNGTQFEFRFKEKGTGGANITNTRFNDNNVGAIQINSWHFVSGTDDGNLFTVTVAGNFTSEQFNEAKKIFDKTDNHIALEDEIAAATALKNAAWNGTSGVSDLESAISAAQTVLDGSDDDAKATQLTTLKTAEADFLTAQNTLNESNKSNFTIRLDHYSNTPVVDVTIHHDHPVGDSWSSLEFNYDNNIHYNRDLEYTFTVAEGQAGTYNLTLNYPGDDNRYCVVQVNDDNALYYIHGTNNGWSSTYSQTTIPVTLKVGANKIYFASAVKYNGKHSANTDLLNSGNGGSFRLHYFTLTKADVTPVVGQRIEREAESKDSGNATTETRSGFSGTKSAGIDDGKYATYNVTVDSDGLYLINIIGIGDGRELNLTVNHFNTITFNAVSENGDWQNPVYSGKLLYWLHAGENTITLAGSADKSAPIIDKLIISRAETVGLTFVKEDGSYSVEVTSAGYATFNAELATTIPDGVTAYTGTISGDKLLLSEVSTTIPANTAVVLKAVATTYTFYSTTDVAAIAGNDLKGTLVATTTPTGALTLGVESEKVGFYNYTGATIPANKAYLTVPGGARSLTIVLGDEAAGIDGVREVKAQSDDVYNLRGQRVAQPGKGLYIVDGKKVLVK